MDDSQVKDFDLTMFVELPDRHSYQGYYLREWPDTPYGEPYDGYWPNMINDQRITDIASANRAIQDHGWRGTVRRIVWLNR